MARFIASLLLVGLVATAGCKKETSKGKPAATATPEPTAAATIALNKGTNTPPPQCKKLCLAVGKCSSKDGKCYAGSSADCKKSFGCRTAGLCEVKDGLCSAVKNSDCEKSDLCETQGRCIAINGRCENKNPGEAK